MNCWGCLCVLLGLLVSGVTNPQNLDALIYPNPAFFWGSLIESPFYNGVTGHVHHTHWITFPTIPLKSCNLPPSGLTSCCGFKKNIHTTVTTTFQHTISNLQNHAVSCLFMSYPCHDTWTWHECCWQLPALPPQSSLGERQSMMDVGIQEYYLATNPCRDLLDCHHHPNLNRQGHMDLCRSGRCSWYAHRNAHVHWEPRWHHGHRTIIPYVISLESILQCAPCSSCTTESASWPPAKAFCSDWTTPSPSSTNDAWKTMDGSAHRSWDWWHAKDPNFGSKTKDWKNLKPVQQTSWDSAPCSEDCLLPYHLHGCLFGKGIIFTCTGSKLQWFSTNPYTINLQAVDVLCVKRFKLKGKLTLLKRWWFSISGRLRKETIWILGILHLSQIPRKTIIYIILHLHPCFSYDLGGSQN